MLLFLGIFAFCAFGVSFLYRMPAGIAGMINRDETATVEAEIMSPTAGYTPTLYGIPVRYYQSQIAQVQSDDNLTGAAAIVGLLAKPFPIAGVTSEALGAATPNSAFPADVLKRGYMTVFCQGSYPAAVPAKNGTVYVRVTAGHSLPVGGIESDADAGACISLITSGPACYFTGPMDSNGMVEIAYNL